MGGVLPGAVNTMTIVGPPFQYKRAQPESEFQGPSTFTVCTRAPGGERDKDRVTEDCRTDGVRNGSNNREMAGQMQFRVPAHDGHLVARSGVVEATAGRINSGGMCGRIGLERIHSVGRATPHISSQLVSSQASQGYLDT